MLACSVLRRALSQRGPARAAAATADVYSPLRMVACVLPSARHAAVAYDVARLCLIAEKRPDTDLRLDEGVRACEWSDARFRRPCLTSCTNSLRRFSDRPQAD